jgi:hypothetical protein
MIGERISNVQLKMNIEECVFAVNTEYFLSNNNCTFLI